MKFRRWESVAFVGDAAPVVHRHFTHWAAQASLDWRLGDPLVVFLALSRGIRVFGEVRRAP